jgi:RHS repeat-associated protein
MLTTARPARGYPHNYPYGEEITSTNNDTFKFAQTYRDSDSGLDYAVNRYYANGIGRFLTPDRHGMKTATGTAPQTWNSYAYVSGNPAVFIDPAGSEACDPDTDVCGDDTCALLEPGDPVPPECQGIGDVDVSQLPEPQLTCNFDNAQWSPGQFRNVIIANGTKGAAFVVPMSINFTASGGDGTYSWAVSQTVSGTGTITYTGGVINATFPTMSDTLVPSELTQNGANANFQDAPGVWVTSPRGLGTIVSTTDLTRTFATSVTVASGNQIVDCPVVEWSISIQWNKGKNPKGTVTSVQW